MCVCGVDGGVRSEDVNDGDCERRKGEMVEERKREGEEEEEGMDGAGKGGR